MLVASRLSHCSSGNEGASCHEYRENGCGEETHPRQCSLGGLAPGGHSGDGAHASSMESWWLQLGQQVEQQAQGLADKDGYGGGGQGRNPQWSVVTQQKGNCSLELCWGQVAQLSEDNSSVRVQ